MKNKTRAADIPANSFIVALAIFTFAVFFHSASAQADGKLRRIHEAVRKHEIKSATKPASNRDGQKKSAKQPENRRRSSESARDSEPHHDDHHSGRVSRRTRHSNYQNHKPGSRGIVFISRPRRYVVPVEIPVSTSPNCPLHYQHLNQQSTFVQPELSKPVFESVVGEQALASVVKPMPQAVDAPLADPFSMDSPAPYGQEVVLEEICVGSDWFATNTSRFWATMGSDFDGVTSVGMGLHVHAPGSIGLDSSVSTLRESNEYYRDHLWIGDVNLVYEVLAQGDVHGRVGLGINWLNDSWGAEAGFNLTAGVDVRLTHRLLISAEGDIGNLGDADFFHGRVNLARRFGTCEWMLGADHYNIGGAETNSFFTGILYRF